MSERYCLDTSALRAFLKEEKGYEQVYSLLELAESRAVEIFYSFMSRYELLYLSQRENKPWGRELLDFLNDFNAKEIACSEEILLKAAELKAKPGKLSACDSWIAASALCANAVLYHKDPEMDSLPVTNKNIS
ncbi:MAG: PIN domain-containing protein [Nitrospinae bacterium]|nr:PIN domain-containing protein [Nitrospinota bacterium]